MVIHLQIEYLNEQLKIEEQKARQVQEPVGERDFEFAERQGCPSIECAKRRLFENGAQWFGTTGSNPPDDEAAVLELQIEYLTAALEREEKLFGQCQKYITTQADFHSRDVGPPPIEQAFTDLENFQTNILKYRDDLTAKKERLHEVRGPSREQRYYQHRAEQRNTAQEAINRSLSFEI